MSGLNDMGIGKLSGWRAVAIVLALSVVAWRGNGAAAVSASGAAKDKGKKSAAAVTDNSVVAKANGEKITVGQLRAAMGELNWKHNRSLLGEENARQMVLRSVVGDRLVLQSMKAAGKLQDPEYRDRMNGVKTLGLGNICVQARRRDYVPSDNEVRRYLPRYWKTVDVRMFFGATREEAEQAAREVAEGGDFARIVKERSIAPGSERGGEMRNLRFGATFLPEHLDHLAFTREKGWISPIFENELGYCFFRIEKSEDVAPEEIERQAAVARKAATDDAIVRMIEDEYLEHKVELDNELLAALDARPMSEWKKDFDRKLADVDGEPVPVREFYWYLATGLGGRSPENAKGRMGELFQSYVRYRGFARKAVREGMENLPEVKTGMASYSEKVLLGMFADGVTRSVKVTGKEAREFFEKKRNAFKKAEGRELRVIALREERVAQETIDLLRADPGRFSGLVKERSVEAGTRRAKGKMGVVEKGRLAPALEKPIFAAKEGELVGPVPYEDLFYIFLVDRKVPALKNPKYSDFAKEVGEMALAEKIQETLRAKRNDLYAKAAVATYPDVLNRVEWPETAGEAVKPTHGMGH